MTDARPNPEDHPARVFIIGNSGSGKSTVAAAFAARGSAHLDLDTVAWLPESPPVRAPLAQSSQAIEAFIAAHDRWVIEGCYADLIGRHAHAADVLIFLDIGTAECQANARQRPWEPHKYPSKEAQDANLPMLLAWIASYDSRDDDLSRAAHTKLAERFAGRLVRLRSRRAVTQFIAGL